MFVERFCYQKDLTLKLTTNIDPLDGLKLVPKFLSINLSYCCKEQEISRVRIKDVAENSQADLMGFEVGDSLLGLKVYTANGTVVDTLLDEEQCRSTITVSSN